MKWIIKNLVSRTALCAILAATVFSVASFADTNTETPGQTPWPSDVSVSAEGACVMDADSGTILYGKNEDTAYYPASITKVMTALVVLENCSDLSEEVLFSQAAVELGEDNATIIGASAGDVLSVEDCLYSLLFKSANEVANALAEHVGAKFPELHENGMNDREVFVAMMNRKAQELGCTNTHFDNPSGLTDPDHYTTAHDMCLILAAAIKNDRFLEIESHTYWTHAPIRRYPDADDPWNTVYASHRMLRKNSPYYYPGVFAGKTGYTMTAGNTLVTACRKNGMTLVTTVLNGHRTHYADTKKLLDFGYQNFHSLNVTDYDTSSRSVQDDLTVRGRSVTDTALLAIDENSCVTLPKEESYSAVQASVSYDLMESDPQDAVARIHYSYQGREVGTAYLRNRSFRRDEALTGMEDDPLYQELTKRSAGETAAMPVGSEEANVSAGETQEENGSAAAAPESGIHLQLSPAVLRVLKILGVILAVLLAGGFLLLQAEKREAQQRARRRQQRLKYTRDLTGQQNMTMDLMVQQKLRSRGRGRRKR